MARRDEFESVGNNHLVLGELFDRHVKIFFSVALQIFRDKHEAEELLQEALRAAQALSMPLAGDCRNWQIQLTYYEGFGRRQRLLAPRLRDEIKVDECEQSLKQSWPMRMYLSSTPKLTSALPPRPMHRVFRLAEYCARKV